RSAAPAAAMRHAARRRIRACSASTGLAAVRSVPPTRRARRCAHSAAGRRRSQRWCAMSSSERLDVTLFPRGLAESRERAQRLIMAGLVLVDGERARHAGKRVRPDADIVVTGADHAYVSRGGVKLAGALDAFAIDPAGIVCVDVGAS